METNDKPTSRPERIVTTGASAAARRPSKPSRLGVVDLKPLAAPQAINDRAASHLWLTNYVPASVDPKAWTAIRGFVTDAARELIDEHDVTREALPRYVRALIKLALYCRSTHQQLDRSTALDPYTVNQFAAGVAVIDPSSAGTYQSHLRYVGERLCPTPLWERPRPVNSRAVAVPYSAPEESTLWNQIRRNTPERCRGGEALMTLGLGAGLDGRWSATRVREDVIEDRDGLLVAVDGRLVPVLSAYESKLRELVADTPPGGLIVGGTAKHKNAANEIASRPKLDSSCPRLNAGRLRSTWIVKHLTLGTRLPELAEAAGTVGITTFSDLLEFVPLLANATQESQQIAREMLRGPR